MVKPAEREHILSAVASGSIDAALGALERVLSRLSPESICSVIRHFLCVIIDSFPEHYPSARWAQFELSNPLPWRWAPPDFFEPGGNSLASAVERYLELSKACSRDVEGKQLAGITSAAASAVAFAVSARKLLEFGESHPDAWGDWIAADSDRRLGIATERDPLEGWAKDSEVKAVEKQLWTSLLDFIVSRGEQSTECGG